MGSTRRARSTRSRTSSLLVFHDETFEGIAQGIAAQPFRTTIHALLARTIERL